MADILPLNVDNIIADAVNILNRAQANCALNPKAANYPYYRAHFAEQTLETIDQVITRRTAVIWPAAGMSLTTLYNKWQQSVAYIKDNLPDQLHKIDFVTAVKHKNIGLKISPRPSAVLQIADQSLDWKAEFLAFLEESNPGENFERIGVLITEADKHWITDIIAPMVTDFVTDIRADKILVVRI